MYASCLHEKYLKLTNSVLTVILQKKYKWEKIELKVWENLLATY